MADPARPLYNFYFRYKWNEVDFAGWQDDMIGILRDSLGSIFGPALISGGAGSAGAGMSVNVAPFVAVAPSGFVNVTTSITNVLVTSDPSNPRKDLIVARKNLVDNTFITRPTSPFDSVPLKQLQESQVIRIPGTPAGSPAYPSKVADDVVLFGVTIPAAAVSLNSTNIDSAVTELLSGNTNFSNWVVGKDVHGTAAIAGDSSATRPVLTLTSNNAQKALSVVGNAATAATIVAGSSNLALDITGAGNANAVNISQNGANGAAVIQNAGSGSALSVGTSGGTGPCFAIAGNNTRAPFGMSITTQPTSGVVGEMYMASGGVLKVCTVTGTPGTWVSVGTQT